MDDTQQFYLSLFAKVRYLYPYSPKQADVRAELKKVWWVEYYFFGLAYSRFILFDDNRKSQLGCELQLELSFHLYW